MSVKEDTIKQYFIEVLDREGRDKSKYEFRSEPKIDTHLQKKNISTMEDLKVFL